MNKILSLLGGVVLAWVIIPVVILFVVVVCVRLLGGWGIVLLIVLGNLISIRPPRSKTYEPDEDAGGL